MSEYRILLEVATLMIMHDARCLFTIAERTTHLQNLVTFTESDFARSQLGSSTTRSAITVGIKMKLEAKDVLSPSLG